jgi:hypothetical protein
MQRGVRVHPSAVLLSGSSTPHPLGPQLGAGGNAGPWAAVCDTMRNLLKRRHGIPIC